MTRVLIVAGDPSGDMIAADLVAAMKRRHPHLVVTGLGGERLRAVSDVFLDNIVRRHALGFAISLRTIAFFRRVLNNVLEPVFRENPPDIVIPVDFYGFNARVARMAKAHGSRVFYYASPQFWASRPGRAETLRSCVDLFLCLFPFEEDFYRARGLPARFIGHPLLDAIPAAPAVRAPRVETLLGLLPGSRPEEIARHLPVMIRACRMIREDHPAVRVLLFTVPHVSRERYQEVIGAIGGGRLLIELVQDEAYAWRSQLDFAITASGMETFENTLIGIPMVVMYKTSWFNYLVARSLIRIPFVGMPNLLAGRLTVPELIQSRATPQAIAGVVRGWMDDPAEAGRVRASLLALRRLFGDPGASDRAARAILEKVA